MRRALGVLVVMLCVSSVEAAPRARARTRTGTTAVPVYLEKTFDRSGETFQTSDVPAPTVSCRANLSTMNCTGATVSVTGSPSFVPSVWYPNGFGASPLYAMQTMSGYTTQNYKTTSPVPASGRFTVCAAWGAGDGLGATAAARIGGWYIQNNPGTGGGRIFFSVNSTGGWGVQKVLDLSPTGSQASVACMGYDQGAGTNTGTLRAFANGSSIEQTSYASPLPDLSAAYIGAGFGAPDGGPMYGRMDFIALDYFDGFFPTAAQLQAMYSKFVGLEISKPASTYFSSTRSTTKTCRPILSGARFTLPPNVPCITERGIKVDPDSTNLVWPSDPTNATWSKSGTATIVDNQAVGLDGRQTMALVTTTSHDDAAYKSVSHASWANAIFAAADVRAVSGTRTARVAVQFGAAPSSCRCHVDVGSCTSITQGSRCDAQATVGTTPVRLTAIGVPSVAVTTSIAVLFPAEHGVSVPSSALFGSVMLSLMGSTSGQAPSDHIPTTTAAATRVLDTVLAQDFTLPAGVPWSLRTRGTVMFWNTPWVGGDILWKLSAATGAETAEAYGSNNTAGLLQIQLGNAGGYSYTSSNAFPIVAASMSENDLTFSQDPITGDLTGEFFNGVRASPVVVTNGPRTWAASKNRFWLGYSTATRYPSMWFKSVRLQKGIRP